MAGTFSYWERRQLKDKAEAVNRSEKFLLKEERKAYLEAKEEIGKEVEKLYQNFADKNHITLAEAKKQVREADFKKIDWQGMIRESRECTAKLKGKDKLPGDVVARLEKQHQELEKKMELYARRGKISYLELRQLEIDRKLVTLYDGQQASIYDFLKSEFDDGYYRGIFRTQQRIGFGKDFVRPNERAVEKAILGRFDKRNYSKSLYAHCRSFSDDLRHNLAVGLIRGENLEKMADRISKRMDVSYSAAKRLVRTEAAYVIEKAAAEAYEACGIEWYEYLATLDGRTTPECQALDGKHFRVKDAVPGKNYPPMHPNCRSTTVSWFPDEEEKKAKTKRLAKNAGGKYYEVPADMTYKEWKERAGVKEYRFIGNRDIAASVSKAVTVAKVIRPMSGKVKDALKKVEIKYGTLRGNGYDPEEDAIYLESDASKKIIEHEVGHAIEDKLFDAGKVKELKKQLTAGLGTADIKQAAVTYADRKVKIYMIDSPDFIDIYQGRIYADSMEDCLDAEGNIDTDKMGEFISVAYQYYMDHAKTMKKWFPEMYELVKESIE